MNEQPLGLIIDTRGLEGFKVVSKDNEKIGTVDGVWEDNTGQAAFVSLKTGWLGKGKVHFVPVYEAEVNESGKTIRLPYDEKTIKGSPEFKSDADIDAASETRLYEYYRVHGKYTEEKPAPDWRAGGRREEMREDSGADRTGLDEDEAAALEADRADLAEEASLKAGRTELEEEPPIEAGEAGLEDEASRRSAASMDLKEEKLHVSKKDVDAGGVRLRKVIRTEIVNQPVELSHEELVVEKEPAKGGGRPISAEFHEEEIFIPLRKEVAEVSKTANVKEKVRAEKFTQKERETLSEPVRKEDVQVDRENRGKKPT